MKEIVKYVCEYCKREYMRKGNAERHEVICWKNKINKSCLTCLFNGGIDTAERLDGSEIYFEYIVCEHLECEGSDNMKPVTNCEYWQEDKRTKKEREKEFASKYISEFQIF